MSARGWALRSPGGRLIVETAGRTREDTADRAVEYFWHTGNVFPKRDPFQPMAYDSWGTLWRAARNAGWCIVRVRLVEEA